MMVAQISSSYMMGDKDDQDDVHDDVHWSKIRISVSVSFNCEGLFPG